MKKLNYTASEQDIPEHAGLIDQIWMILNTNDRVLISNLTTMLFAMENIIQPKMVNANN